MSLVIKGLVVIIILLAATAKILVYTFSKLNFWAKPNAVDQLIDRENSEALPYLEQPSGLEDLRLTKRTCPGM
jgi:hypothetical protein